MKWQNFHFDIAGSDSLSEISKKKWRNGGRCDTFEKEEAQRDSVYQSIHLTRGTALVIYKSQQQRSSISQEQRSIPKIVLPKTPHGTVADLRRVAEEVVAPAVVGPDEAKPFVVPGDADARLARAALAAELAALGRAAATAGVARARAAGPARRAARARARLVAARGRAISHVWLL